jgi:hypothetical protein
MTPKKTSTFVHVGFPKCGSTSLQANLFRLHPQLQPFCPIRGGPKTTFSGAVKTISLFEALATSGDEAALEFQTLWHEYLDPMRDASIPNVLSDEHLCFGSAPLSEVFSRLSSVDKSIDIVIVIRSQVDLLRSMYDMVPVEGVDGTKYLSFEKWVDWALSGDFPLANRLFYRDVIKAANAEFGSRNVHVFSLEGLFRDGSERNRLADLLRLEETDMSTYLDASHKNSSSQHAARKLARRILGPVRASWILPKKARRWLLAWMSKFVANKQTEVSNECRQKIKSFYGKQFFEVTEMHSNNDQLREYLTG